MKAYRLVETQALVGHTFDDVWVLDRSYGGILAFVDYSKGKAYLFGQWTDRICDKELWLEDICGDLDNLKGSPITKAEDVSDENTDEWTFYKLETVKGRVTLRWCGESDMYSTWCEILEVDITDDFKFDDVHYIGHNCSM